jgi:magnesium transporter
MLTQKKMSYIMQKIVDALTQSMQKNSSRNSLHLIESLSAAEVARVIESLPNKFRLTLWELVPSPQKGEVLLELHGDLRRWVIKNTNEDVLFENLTSVQMDELADLDDDLPVAFVTFLVEAMDARRRQGYELVQHYPDDSAGGLMDTDATSVRPDVTLRVVLRYLRRLRIKEGNLPEHLDSLIVVDRDNKFVGTLPLSILVSSNVNEVVEQVMVDGVPGITPFQSALQVARNFEDRDLLSAPVIDDNGHVLGRITVDDVIDVIRDEADRKILGRAGLEQHPDMFGPIGPSSYRRALWLGLNLITAFIAAWVISLFDTSIEKLVSLAVLMPVVASMGGVAGNQTLTLVTRGIALEQIGRSNLWLLVGHEMGIGVINGIFWALIVAFVANLWFGGWSLGLIFGSAVLITMLTGVIAGALIPLWLKRLGIDPAIAGGVVLTTATDAVGFFVFLGLATLFLL